MKKKIICSFIAFFAVITNIYTQAGARQKEFNTAYSAYISKTIEKFSGRAGIAIVVIKEDQPVFVQAYGMADMENGINADVNTLFYIASSTKSFTGLAAALLDKEGKIRLDDPVTRYAKGISVKNPIPDKVTIRDLLTHTSGLKNDALTFRMAYSGESDVKDMANVFGGATSFIDSNYNKYDYDNLGYNVYAVLLQNTYSKKWQDLLQEKVFTPLNMKHTAAYISKAATNKWTVARPYIFSGESGSIIRSPLDKTDNNMQSAGGIFSSITDIGTWLNMNMNNGKLNGKQVIPADIIQKCQTGYTKTFRDQPPFTGEGEYGLGWQIGKYKNEKVIYHHGGFPGYRSHISFMPDKKIAVAVLTNDGAAVGRAGNILATYAYEWWLNVENMQADYDKQLQDQADSYEKGKAMQQKSAADRAKRISQLSMPLETYIGKYNNEYFGNVEITIVNNALAVNMGNIHCLSSNFTQPETIRVELVPGSGEVVKFKKSAENKIESFHYAGVEFAKLK